MIKYLLLILTFLTGSIPYYKEIREKIKKIKLARRERKKREYRIDLAVLIFLILLLFAGSIGSAIVQYNTDTKDSKDSVRLDDNFSTLKAKNDYLKRKSDTLSKQLNDKTEDLYVNLKKAGQEFTDTLNEAAANLTNNMTGGKAYPFAFISGANSHFSLQLINSFKNAIPNTHVVLEDYDATEQGCIIPNTDHWSIQCMIKHMYGETFIIPAHDWVYWENSSRYIKADGQLHRLLVKFDTPYKHWIEQIEYLIEDGQSFKILYRLAEVSDKGHKVLKQKGSDKVFKLDFRPLVITYY